MVGPPTLNSNVFDHFQLFFVKKCFLGMKRGKWAKGRWFGFGFGSFTKLLDFDYNYLNIESGKQMQQRYDSRRFHRSPKMTPLSPQALPLNSVITGRQFMSPVPRNNSESEQQGYQNEASSYMVQPNLGNVLQRLAQVQLALREQKSERLDEHTKLIKLIKQMQCKHSAIIYDSEIRYNKSLVMPELYSAIVGKDKGIEREGKESEKSMKKVSSYVMDKSGQARADLGRAGTAGRNMKMSDVEVSKKTQASQQMSKLDSMINQNPERKPYSNKIIPEHKRTGSGSYNVEQIASQPQNFDLQKLQQKMSAQLQKKFQTLLTQSSSGWDKKFLQLKESLKTVQSKLQSQLSSLTTAIQKQSAPVPVSPALQQNLAALKRETTAELSRNSADLLKLSTEVGRMTGEYSRILGELNKQSNEFSKVYGELTRHTNEINRNSSELTKYSSQLAKHQQELLTHENQLSRHSSELARSVHNTAVSNLSSQVQRLQLEFNSLQSNTKSSTLSEISQISYKLQEMYGIFNDFSVPLREKLEEFTIVVGEQNQKINSIRNFCQSDYQSLGNKLCQVQSYFVLKSEANEKQMRDIKIEFGNILRAIEEDRIRKQGQDREQEGKRLEQERMLDEKIESKMNAKGELIRVANLKEIQGFNNRLETGLLSMIERHIGHVEGYLKTVEEKQKFLIDRFVNSCEEQASVVVTPSQAGGYQRRITGGLEALYNRPLGQNS